MNGIFISYRRDDSAGYAGRLYDRLIAAFGADRVFMDVEGIELGTDFIAAIERALDSSSVFIALIGSEWTQSKDAAGRRRLDDPQDFIRLETVMAIERKLRIVPVLVDDAAMPRADELPSEMSSLARRQAIEINHRQWDASTGALIRALRPIIDSPSGGKENTSTAIDTGDNKRNKRTIGIAVGVLALILLAGLAYVVGWRGKADAPEPPTLAESIPTIKPAVKPAIEPTAKPPIVPTPAPLEKPPPAPVVEAKPVPAVPRLETGASTLDFGVIDLGAAKSSSLRVRNAGDAAADVAAPVVRGKHAADYRVSTDCGKRLQAGASCNVDVGFKPGAAGVRSAIIEIAGAEGQPPLRIALSGRGKAPAVSAESTRPVVSEAPRAAPVVSAEDRIASTTHPTTSDRASAGRLAVGDRWAYRYRSKWGNVREKTFQFAVTGVDGDVVMLALSELGVESPQAPTRQRVGGGQPAILEWLGFGKEFSPFIGAFGGLIPDARWSGMSASEPSGFVGRWNCRGKAAGSEQVRVPAGSFDATLVSIDCNRQTSGSVGEKAVEPTWTHFDIWYAANAKRYVKLVRREVTVDRTESDKDTIELVDYRLGSSGR